MDARETLVTLRESLREVVKEFDHARYIAQQSEKSHPGNFVYCNHEKGRYHRDRHDGDAVQTTDIGPDPDRQIPKVLGPLVDLRITPAVGALAAFTSPKTPQQWFDDIKQRCTTMLNAHWGMTFEEWAPQMDYLRAAVPMVHSAIVELPNDADDELRFTVAELVNFKIVVQPSGKRIRNLLAEETDDNRPVRDSKKRYRLPEFRRWLLGKSENASIATDDEARELAQTVQLG